MPAPRGTARDEFATECDWSIALGRRFAAAGVRAALVYSSGFAEEGGASADIQARVREIARATGLTVGGPNVVGFMNVVDAVVATFSPAVDLAALPALRADPRERRIGIVSQSGGLGFALFNRGL
jgi:acyl-CoA synthetase (NDP forming)